jgi:hypothetical protein
MSLWGLQTKRCSSGRLRKSCNGYARTTMASKESATFYLHIPVACVFVCARARVCMQCARLDAQRFYSAVSAFSNLTGWHLDRLHKEDYIRRSASLPSRVLMPSGKEFATNGNCSAGIRLQEICSTTVFKTSRPQFWSRRAFRALLRETLAPHRSALLL